MNRLKPPAAEKKEHLLVNHGDTLIDNYFWLREKDNPEVVRHLENENAWQAAVMADASDLQDNLFAEMKVRIKEEDESVPMRYGDNYYYSKTVKDKQYHEHYRKRGSLDAAPELILDCNALAEGHEYFDLGTFSISPNQKYLAYSSDLDGSESYNLYVKNMETGELLPDILRDISSAEWAMDNKTLFYTVRDEAWRPYRVFRHRLGAPQDSDTEVYHEPDERFSVDVERSKNDKYMMMTSESQITSEYRLAPADNPEAEFKVFFPRRQNVEYHVIPHIDKFYVLTNSGEAFNFKLTEVSEDDIDETKAREIIAHNPDVKLEDIDEYRDFIVLTLRENGLNRIKIINLVSGSEDEINFPEPAYSLGSAYNPNFDDTKLPYVYTSMTRPATTYEYDMLDKSQQTLKQGELAVPYNPDDYVSERLYATAADGVKIPVSIVYRKGFGKNGKAPLLLYGYGSYGISIDPSFSGNRLSLLDRGFACAIAHIRGGADLGEQWYLDGKLDRKKNTFTDFIACAEMLQREGYTSPQYTGVMGGSAGGLLMGAVTNLRPELFRAVVADVPFVDVMNTMCDATLPLTAGEYEEWGNPAADREAYEYMKSYSPYDNIRPAAYPAILATAGFNDPRVSYWEVAKWVLKLRENNESENPVLLKVNMGAGHGGASGRYDYLKEIAMEYAFLIMYLQ